jgi:hypothetical protein
MVLILTSFDKLLIWVWNRFIRYRQLWDFVSGETFMEGW